LLFPALIKDQKQIVAGFENPAQLRWQFVKQPSEDSQ
jgi:hypothetical protein